MWLPYFSIFSVIIKLLIQISRVMMMVIMMILVVVVVMIHEDIIETLVCKPIYSQ
jgi:hypothetical protein